MSNKKYDFEAAMKRLEEISVLMARDGITLEESLSLYEEGVKLARECNGVLEDTERRIKILKLTADGEMAEEDFCENRTEAE